MTAVCRLCGDNDEREVCAACVRTAARDRSVSHGPVSRASAARIAVSSQHAVGSDRGVHLTGARAMCAPAAYEGAETHVCTAAAHAAVETSKGRRRAMPFSDTTRHPRWLPLSIATNSLAIGQDWEIAGKRVFRMVTWGSYSTRAKCNWVRAISRRIHGPRSLPRRNATTIHH